MNALRFIQSRLNKRMKSDAAEMRRRSERLIPKP